MDVGDKNSQSRYLVGEDIPLLMSTEGRGIHMHSCKYHSLMSTKSGIQEKRGVRSK